MHSMQRLPADASSQYDLPAGIAVRDLRVRDLGEDRARLEIDRTALAEVKIARLARIDREVPERRIGSLAVLLDRLGSAQGNGGPL